MRTTMKKSLLIVALISLSGLLIQCSDSGTAETNKSAVKTYNVRVVPLEPRSFSEYLEVTGTVKARNQIKLLAEEGGILNRIMRDKGRFVSAGDTLAILENKVLEAGYKQAQAALKQAQLDFDSKKVLYEKKAISANEYLASKYGLERAQATNDLARARFDKLFITAPMSGFVNERYYDLGAYAQPMTPLFEFIDNAQLIISAGVAERFLRDIKIGTKAEIGFDAFPGLVLNSKVTFVSRSIDPINRTFLVEMKVDNPDRKLNPQMIANVKLLRRAFDNSIVIPIDAIIDSEQGSHVFIENGTKAHKKPVKIKAIYEDSVMVEGLAPGQKLVIVGQRELTDGDPLEILN